MDHWQTMVGVERPVTDEELELITTLMPCYAVTAATSSAVGASFPAIDADTACTIFRNVLREVLYAGDPRPDGVLFASLTVHPCKLPAVEVWILPG